MRAVDRYLAVWRQSKQPSRDLEADHGSGKNLMGGVQAIHSNRGCHATGSRRGRTDGSALHVWAVTATVDLSTVEHNVGNNSTGGPAIETGSDVSTVGNVTTKEPKASVLSAPVRSELGSLAQRRLGQWPDHFACS
jgi:hypothetical protein